MPEAAQPAAATVTEFSLSDFADLCAGMSRLLVGLSTAPPFSQGRLGLSEWVALSILSREEGIGNNQLARKIGVSNQRANQITAALSQAGMIVIGVSPVDSRRSEIRLTLAGRRELQAMDADIRRLLTAAIGGRERLPSNAARLIRRMHNIVILAKKNAT